MHYCITGEPNIATSGSSGLFANLELGMLKGPLFVGQEYRLEREVVAPTSQHRGNKGQVLHYCITARCRNARPDPFPPVHGLFRNARNPGVLDPAISLMQAIGEDGLAITTIVHFACHVESLQAGAREISADFPGYMCEQIKIDGGGQPVFLNGALGGMVSGDNRERTHESAREMGLKLAAIVRDLAATAQASGVHAFSVDQRSQDFSLKTNSCFEDW